MKFDAKKIFINPYTISFVAAILLLFIIYKATFAWLNSYTNHGQELIVPDLVNMMPDKASELLEKQALKYEVIDSIYVKDKPLGAIAKQTPEAGAKIKEGRTIYLTVNSSTVRKVPMPDIREYSLRQAESMLHSVGLKVDSIVYVTSEFKDLVQSVKQKNMPIEVGMRIPEGSAVTLFVGRGLNNELCEVPSFRKLTLERATNMAHTSFLNIGKVIYNEEPIDDDEKAQYIVFKQEPVTASKVSMGSAIKLYMTKDLSLLETVEEIYYNDENPSEAKTEEEDLFK
ncbi:MAG: PASTA domain-containing protein [Paludibacteraceae bacterium]|nr:PASTA domain-containing protein [Paludibacteraceae bacterium]